MTAEKLLFPNEFRRRLCKPKQQRATNNQCMHIHTHTHTNMRCWAMPISIGELWQQQWMTVASMKSAHIHMHTSAYSEWVLLAHNWYLRSLRSSSATPALQASTHTHTGRHMYIQENSTFLHLLWSKATHCHYFLLVYVAKLLRQCAGLLYSAGAL